METKHEKFVRLSGPRVDKAVYHIDLIANLASSNYEFSALEARAIHTRLTEAVERIATAFEIPPSRPTPEAPQAPVEMVEREPAVVVPPAAGSDLIQGPLNVIDVRWALDKIIYGDTDEAKALLQRALLNEDRTVTLSKVRT